jgi:hypothetical protein
MTNLYASALAVITAAAQDDLQGAAVLLDDLAEPDVQRVTLLLVFALGFVIRAYGELAEDERDVHSVETLRAMLAKVVGEASG